METPDPPSAASAALPRAEAIDRRVGRWHPQAAVALPSVLVCAASGGVLAGLMAGLVMRGGLSGATLAGLVAAVLVLAGLGARSAKRGLRRSQRLRARESARAAALERREQQLRLAEQVAGFGSFDWSVPTGELHWSDQHYRLWGLAPGSVTPCYEVFRQGLHPDDLQAVETLLKRALAGELTYDCRHRVRRPDGTECRIHARGEVFRDTDGRPHRMIGTVHDVTALEADRLALASSLEHLKRVLGATGDAMFAYDVDDPDGRLLFANPQFFDMWRIPPEQAPATGRAEIIVAARRLFADPDAGVQRILEILRLDTPHEDRVELNDGRVLWRRSVPMHDGRHAARVWSFRDITAEERAVSELRAAEAEQRVLLDAFPGFIGAVDQDLRYTFANARLADLHGWQVQDMVGRPAREVVGEPRAQEMAAEIARAREGVPVVVQRRHRHRLTGQPVDLQITHVVRPRAGGGYTCFTFGLDITELKRAEDALVVARDEAERANLAKSQFLSSMSHELRTPLNAIIGFGQLLETDAEKLLPLRHRGYLREIVRGGQHLLVLIDDVLDLARIEAGALPVRREAVDLAELVQDCLDFVVPMARARSVRVRTEAMPAAGCHVLADRTRLKQVLLNLLSNAIKYNREGGEVRLAGHLDAATVRIDIADDGPGLSAEQQLRLFQAFERLDADRTATPGTGIGLALSRRLVEAMHGEIGVDSAPSEGSRFWVRLARAEAPARADDAAVPRLAAPARRSATDAAPQHVLYIEDNPVNTMLMQALLSRLPGVRLSTAALPAVGLELARSDPPALVLLDIQLPGMDGFEVLRRLRADPATAGIPVIAVSANAMPDDLERARAAGFDDYLTKPLRLARLEQLVAERVAAAGLRPAPAGAPAAVPHLP